MRFLRENALSLVLLVVIAFASVYFYPTLPDQVPSHFDLNGNPNEYRSREFIVLFLPLFFGSILALVGLLVKFSPEKFSMPNSRMALNRILFGTGLLFTALHLGLMLEPSSKGSLEKFLCFGMALFMIVAGNVMGKTERNFFIGIRLPWTINSEQNWRATHRFAGKLMVIFGVALFAVSFVKASTIIMMIGLFVPIVAPAIYSFIYYRKHELPAA